MGQNRDWEKFKENTSLTSVTHSYCKGRESHLTFLRFQNSLYAERILDKLFRQFQLRLEKYQPVRS